MAHKFTGKTSDYLNNQSHTNSTSYTNINGTESYNSTQSGYRYEGNQKVTGDELKKAANTLFSTAVTTAKTVTPDYLKNKFVEGRIKDYGSDEAGFAVCSTVLLCVFAGTGVIPVIVAAPLGVVPLGFAVQSSRKKKVGRRMLSYWKILQGSRQFSLSKLSDLTSIPMKTIHHDLDLMLGKGMLKEGFLDKSNQTLVLANVDEYIKAYQAPQQGIPSPVADHALLQEIAEVNRGIQNVKLSGQVDHIAMITGKILGFQEENNSQDRDIERFLSYYLPTTLKLLRSYGQMEAQNIEGENISKSKAQIETMMDKIVEGFEKQLDQLFRSETMDVALDIAVLEQMFEKDGLSGNVLKLELPKEPVRDINLKL